MASDRGRLVRSGRVGDTIRLLLPDGEEIIITCLPRKSLHINAPLDVEIKANRQPLTRNRFGNVDGVVMADGRVQK